MVDLSVPSNRSVSPVAVLAQGEAEWIAGRVYTSNLLRALTFLPKEERIDACLMFPHTAICTDLSELPIGHWPVRYYSFRETHSIRQKLSSTKQSLLLKRWPRSLE